MNPLWLSMLYGRGGGAPGMPMPGIGTPGAPSPTPQTGLRLADLLMPAYEEPPMPEEPRYPTSVRELAPERQSDLRLESLIATLGSGLAAPPGQMGTGMLAGALQGRDRQQQAVEAEKGRLQEEFRAAKARAQEEAMRRQQMQAMAREKQEAEALFSTYQEIERLAGPDNPDLIAEAKAAAMARSMPGLQKVLADAPDRVAFRRALSAAGVDWKNPLAVKAHQEELEREGRMDEALELEEELRRRQLGRYEPAPPPAPPAPREGTVFIGQDGRAYLIDQVTGAAKEVALPGGEPVVGGFRVGREGGSDDPLWTKAVEAAQAERNRSATPRTFDVLTRARRLYSIYKSGPGGGGAAGAGGGGRPGGAAAPDQAVVGQVAKDLGTMPEDQVLADLREDFSPAEAARILKAAKARRAGGRR